MEPSKKQARIRRSFTKEYKDDAVRLCKQGDRSIKYRSPVE